MGRITAAWGIKGWFKVSAFSPQPDTLLQAAQWHLQIGTSTCLLPVAAVRASARGMVAASPAIADRNAAERLRGAHIFLPRSAFAPPEKDEYYWVDLLGARVTNRQGLLLGQVQDLIAGAQTTLVVRQAADGSERLIPFVAAYIDQVDVAQKTIVANWLLEWEI